MMYHIEYSELCFLGTTCTETPLAGSYRQSHTSLSPVFKILKCVVLLMVITSWINDRIGIVLTTTRLRRVKLTRATFGRYIIALYRSCIIHWFFSLHKNYFKWTEQTIDWDNNGIWNTHNMKRRLQFNKSCSRGSSHVVCGWRFNPAKRSMY